MKLSAELKIGTGLTILFVMIVLFSIIAGRPIPQTQNETPIVPPKTSVTTFTLSEVAKHSRQNDCWIIVRNNIYNVTDFLFVHQGGAGQIIPYCGVDATAAFESIGKHVSARAQTDLTRLLIGSIK